MPTESKLKILVVDDDEEIRSLLKQRLGRENGRFDVEGVPGGEECLQYVGSHRVDCIISDYQMNGMDGVTLLTTLREFGYDTPVIFFTGQGNEVIATQAFRAGAFDYFTKDLMGFAKFARITNSIEQSVRQRVVDEYRVQAERELADEKQRLDDILFHLGVGISIQDTDFRITYQNSVHTEMIGEHVGEYCYKAYEGRDSVCEDCPMAMTFEDGRTHRASRKTNRNGRDIFVELVTSPVLGPSGEVVSCIEVVEDLTETKSKEDALKLSELRFRMLFEGANDAIILADAMTGEILEANLKAGELLGMPREEIIGMHQTELHPPELENMARSVFRAHTEGPDGGVAIVPVLRKDGSEVFVEISGSNFELGGRKVIQGIFRDVTERLDAEAEIRRSEARYREAEQIAKIGSWEWIVQMDEVNWSDGMFSIFGVRREDFGKTYQSYLDFVVPEDKERVMGLVAESLKGEAPLDYTTRFIRNDGEDRYLYIYGRATLDREGKPVRLFGTAQDVTEMMKAEDEVRRSETRYREAENIAGVGSWEWDVSGDRVTWSEGLYRIFGLDPDNFGETYQSFLDYVVSEDRERVMGLVAESLKGESPLIYETRIVRSDGKLRDIYVHAGLAHDDEGKAVRMYGTVHDITERKRSEDALIWELSLNRALSGLSTWLIDRTSSIEDMANVTLEFARALTDSTDGFISSVETGEDGGTALVMKSVSGSGCGLEDARNKVDMSPGPDGEFEGLCGEVLNTHMPLFTNDPASHVSFGGAPDGHIQLDNYLAVPAMIGDELFGMIALANKAGGYCEDDLNIVSKLAEFYSLALERMRAEEDVRESETLLKTVLGAMPDIVFIHEKDGTITNVFHSEDAKLYAPRDEFIGRPLDEVLPVEIAGKAVEAIRAALASGGPETFEYSLGIGGEESVFEARVVPFGDCRALSVIRDITLEKKVELELKSSEERFRQLADNIDGVLWMSSADRETMYYLGPAFERIWGRDTREVLEDPWAWLGFIHPEDRDRVRDQVKNTPLHERHMNEYRILRQDGETRWIRNRTFPITDGNAKVSRIAGIAEDITGEKNLQKQREDLFSMVRHDVRTPLSVIAGNAEMLAEELVKLLDTGSIEMLRSIQNSAKNLSRMLDDLAAISKLESGNMPFRTDSTDVTELVLEASANMHAAIQKKGHSFVKRVEDDLPVITVDQSNVLRALTNMLQNAVIYTPEGGEITVAAYRTSLGDRPAVAISVTDNGPGIPHEEHKRVFEKRYRSAASAGVKGSGLGLAIVRLVAEAHGGVVELDSSPGKGSEFRMVLPAD